MQNPEKTVKIKKNIFKFNFFVDFIIICLVTFGVLYFFGFVPNELRINDTKSSVLIPIKDEVKTEEAKVKGELPIEIKIASIGVLSNIYNPETADIKTMDEYLLHGVVRYPGSGLLGVGNVFLFAHSTGYKVVNNQAYKTFNGLGKLKVGDEIVVYSSSTKYIYSVSNVEMKTASKVEVDLSIKKNMLTLSTCNVFGDKEDRYVVEATFVSKK